MTKLEKELAKRYFDSNEYELYEWIDSSEVVRGAIKRILVRKFPLFFSRDL